MRGTGDAGETADPSGQVLAQAEDDVFSADSPDTNMAQQAVSTSGSSQSHVNIQPFQCIHFIVALFGIYPSRT
jgi:microcystin-dependent protein